MHPTMKRPPACIAVAAVKLLAPLAAAQSSPTTRPAWDSFADTWVATDGRGRPMPTFAEVGPPGADGMVGMFYYLCNHEFSRDSEPAAPMAAVGRRHAKFRDAVHRDFPGVTPGLRHVNQTGRNDLVAAKVGADAATVHFYVRTAAPIAPSSDPDWVVL